MLEAVAPPSRTHRFARLRPILRLPSHLTPAAGLALCRAAGLALCRTAGLTLCRTAGLTLCRTAGLTLCRTAGLTLCRAAGLALCRAAGLALCLAPSLAPCAAAQAPVLAGAPHALAESDLQSLAQLAARLTIAQRAAQQALPGPAVAPPIDPQPTATAESTPPAGLALTEIAGASAAQPSDDDELAAPGETPAGAAGRTEPSAGAQPAATAAAGRDAERAAAVAGKAAGGAASAAGNPAEGAAARATDVRPGAAAAAGAPRGASDESAEYGVEHQLSRQAAASWLDRVGSWFKGVAHEAMAWLGTPYRRGGASRRGIDCSGLTGAVFARRGIDLPRTAAEQFALGLAVGLDEMRPGDLVFFRNTYKRGISHVGIYVGDGRFIHAAGRRQGVIVSDLARPYYQLRFAGARRLATPPGDSLAARPRDPDAGASPALLAATGTAGAGAASSAKR